MDIKAKLVKKLIQTQFPQWAHLAIRPVKKSGHDNRTFLLGDEMLIRLPSGKNMSYKLKKKRDGYLI